MGAWLGNLKMILVVYMLGKVINSVLHLLVSRMPGTYLIRRLLELYPGVLSHLFHSMVILTNEKLCLGTSIGFHSNDQTYHL
jgi:hypothetical protein